jgi:hypothetical protein
MWISFFIGLVLGAAAVYLRVRAKSRARRRIPREWPLTVRPLVNSKEKRVWIWLSKVMFDQHILVKLPVTRFTTPSSQQEAPHWYKLLNGVYCTFTVCSMDGKVIGCVDVPGRSGLSLSNQTLKHSLLEQCGIRYWVVDPEHLPHLTQIRSAFLGPNAIMGSERDLLDSRFQDVRENLQAAVTRRRSSLGQESTPAELEARAKAQIKDSRLSSGWEQNSFMTPLDSRSGDLKR